MMTRSLHRAYTAYDSVPHILNQSQYQRNNIQVASTLGVHLPYGYEPMMDAGRGTVIPAAQDPTDPSTWRVPVVFT